MLIYTWISCNIYIYIYLYIYKYKGIKVFLFPDQLRQHQYFITEMLIMLSTIK